MDVREGIEVDPLPEVQRELGGLGDCGLAGLLELFELGVTLVAGRLEGVLPGLALTTGDVAVLHPSFVPLLLHVRVLIGDGDVIGLDERIRLGLDPLLVVARVHTVRLNECCCRSVAAGHECFAERGRQEPGHALLRGLGAVPRSPFGVEQAPGAAEGEQELVGLHRLATRDHLDDLAPEEVTIVVDGLPFGRPFAIVALPQADTAQPTERLEHPPGRIVHENDVVRPHGGKVLRTQQTLAVRVVALEALRSGEREHELRTTAPHDLLDHGQHFRPHLVLGPAEFHEAVDDGVQLVPFVLGGLHRRRQGVTPQLEGPTAPELNPEDPDLGRFGEVVAFGQVGADDLRERAGVPPVHALRLHGDDLLDRLAHEPHRLLALPLEERDHALEVEDDRD